VILTDEEKAYLEGSHGEANRLAMELLVSLGESFGAERLIPIASAHILGHYGSLHQAGIDFLEKLAEGGGQCRVPTTVDPSSVDFERWKQFKIPEEYVEKQKRLQIAVEKLGVIPSWSCTPYLSINVPRYGQNIAWAESSAIVYANSVIGARTNRTPFGLDICAAITGKIPEFGLYIDENRRGSLLFDVKIEDFSDLDYHTLGAIIGSRSGADIPVIKGIPANSTNDQLKCFGAGAASAGSVALYHALGITPEAQSKDPFGGKEPKEVFAIGRKDLGEMEDQISTADPNAKVEMVTLGCPLLSIEELKAIFRKMQKRRVRKDMYCWIYLTRETYDIGKALGLIDPLERAGIWFSTQTCATISPVRVWGFSHVMTNSAKCALVVPSEHDVKITYRDTDGCIVTATEPA
jgi:predicted aconitase